MKCTLYFHLYCKSRCFWRYLHRWQKFYAAACSDGIDKYHLWTLAVLLKYLLVVKSTLLSMIRCIRPLIDLGALASDTQWILEKHLQAFYWPGWLSLLLGVRERCIRPLIDQEGLPGWLFRGPRALLMVGGGGVWRHPPPSTLRTTTSVK